MTRLSRRRFLGAAATAATFGPAAAAGRAADPGPKLAKPTAAQLAWQDAEIGLLYCFDLPVAASVFAPNNTVRDRLDPKRYHPSKLDTDQWIEAARAAGAGYAVFTATHFSGFMQWQSDLYPYGLKQTRWRDGKGDVVADFVESCCKAGIKPGIYFSTHRNVWQTVWGHYVDWGRGKGTEKQEAYNRIAEKQTEELCSRYGKLLEIWYDAGVKTPEEGGPDVLPIFEKLQPDSVFYHSAQRCDHRWIGNEAGHAGVPCWATMPGDIHGAAWRRALYRGDPEGPVWSPGMVDVPLRGAGGVHHWFWKPNAEKGVYTPEQLVEMYYRSVGRNANYIIGVVIQPDGSVPEPDAASLAAFGKEIRRRFDKPLGETQGEGPVVELELSSPQKIDHLVVMEDVAHGQRVRAYELEGLVAGNDWHKLAEGASIGHKCIQRIDPTEVAAVRLRVTHSAAPPLIQKLAVYHVG